MIIFMRGDFFMKMFFIGTTRGRHSFSGKSSTEDPINVAAVNGGKPFGLVSFPALITFLNANIFLMNNKIIMDTLQCIV